AALPMDRFLHTEKSLRLAERHPRFDSLLRRPRRADLDDHFTAVRRVQDKRRLTKFRPRAAETLHGPQGKPDAQDSFHRSTPVQWLPRPGPGGSDALRCATAVPLPTTVRR